MSEEQENLKHRSCDHPDEYDNHRTPCQNLTAYITVQEQLLVDMHEMKHLMEQNAKLLFEIKEMVTAWKNVKGFIRTLAIIGTVAKWLTVTGASIAAIYYWFKQ